MDEADLNQVVRISVIEDNPADVDLLRMGLEDADLKFELTVVDDGAEALSYFTARETRADAAAPDLAILDLHLPKYDGFELISAARSNPRFERLPVAVLSSSSSARELERLSGFDCLRFIHKPADLDQCLQVGQTIRSFLLEKR